MCEVLKVDQEKFLSLEEKEEPGCKRPERRVILSTEIFSIYHWSLGRYGSPRIARELEAKGMRASCPLVSGIKAESRFLSDNNLAIKLARNESPVPTL
ncbi:hypothetical protein [Chryseobacterium indoltheticum]|uniref:hypothetical protein n=1 Tax=Chryseobacterium indoltheticum TaxID=254 RepID=UPI003F49453A